MMKIFLSILQILIGLHTAIGGMWKFSNTSEQTMPSFAVIPNWIWLQMGVIELFCALVLIVSVLNKPLAKFVPLAAGVIVAEMILFSGLHLYFGEGDYSSLIYWFVVAAICAFIAYGRLVIVPTNHSLGQSA
ncbi:MAG: DoxX family protein [Idiomarina sp.]|nr:DoxX family protein [Idiomarina sp.]